MSLPKKDSKPQKDYRIYSLIFGLILGLIGYFAPLPYGIKLFFYIAAYTLLLYRTANNALKALLHSHSLNENALITISCIGALCLGEVLEGMMVIALYTIGKILEAKAVDNSRRSIQNLIDLKQTFAHRKTKNRTTKIAVEEITPGDILLVKKGEKVPVDGVVTQGTTLLDNSALTGESEPVNIKKSDQIYSGGINLGSAFEFRATTNYSNSTTAKILELLETASEKKAKTETIITKVSRVYTPIILVLAIAVTLILPTAFQIAWPDAIYRALTFLVIACPCAIAISIPLAYFTAIGVASKHGVLIKGSNYLDNLYRTRNIIFDKTGTLTDGSFTVSEIKITSSKYSKSQIVELLAAGEALSNHPIAHSIVKLYSGKPKTSQVKNFQETDGRGISYDFQKHHIIVGNQLACRCDEDAILHLNIDGTHAASITINDGIKPGAAQVVSELQQQKIQTYMFTGDKALTAKHIAEKLNLDHFYAEMLPTDKFRRYEQVAKNGLTVFVGDGINDAPTLRRADIGIAMGGIGSESAIESADVVILDDDLAKLPFIFQLSHFTKQIIFQNLFFAIAIKLSILVLSVFGLTNMWWAVFADTGVTLLAILNTLRIIAKFKKVL